MHRTPWIRRFAVVLLGGVLSIGATLPVMAKNSVSQGHGVKCQWVLTDSQDGNNTYIWVCNRGA